MAERFAFQVARDINPGISTGLRHGSDRLLPGRLLSASDLRNGDCFWAVPGMGGNPDESSQFECVSKKVKSVDGRVPPPFERGSNPPLFNLLRFHPAGRELR